MKKIVAFAAMLLTVFALPALAQPVIGQDAPAFTLTDSNGKSVSLADFKGKTVVLEWTNDGCPFVQKHYNANNMQALQKRAAGDGVIWLTVISSAPGTQGHVTGEEANALTTSRNAAPAAVLLDETGAVGKLYGAKTTPHMYVIDTEGKLVYEGAIDNKPSPRESDIKDATNYVQQALDELKAGKSVSVSTSKAYGCGIKYAE